jgi:hypothetical protein
LAGDARRRCTKQFTLVVVQDEYFSYVASSTDAEKSATHRDEAVFDNVQFMQKHQTTGVDELVQQQEANGEKLSEAGITYNAI